MDHRKRAAHLMDSVTNDLGEVYTDSTSQAIVAAAQVHATLALEAQAKRIADALEAANSDEPPRSSDGRYRLDTDLDGM